MFIATVKHPFSTLQVLKAGNTEHKTSLRPFIAIIISRVLFLCMHAQTVNKYLNTRIHSNNKQTSKQLIVSALMYIYTCTCQCSPNDMYMYVYTCIYVHVHVYMYIIIHTYMYMYTCIYM